jgi:hypothetical protein
MIYFGDPTLYQDHIQKYKTFDGCTWERVGREWKHVGQCWFVYHNTMTLIDESHPSFMYSDNANSFQFTTVGNLGIGCDVSPNFVVWTDNSTNAAPHVKFYTTGGYEIKISPETPEQHVPPTTFEIDEEKKPLAEQYKKRHWVLCGAHPELTKVLLEGKLSLLTEKGEKIAFTVVKTEENILLLYPEEE